MKYKILDVNLPRLEKKLSRISGKCEKLGIPFRYEQVEEVTEKVVVRDCPIPHTEYKRYIIVDVEGTAIVNGWEFIGSIEHTGSGNIIKTVRKVDVPERYFNAHPVCEHCGTARNRANTYLVRNIESGEFKQVGKSCLCDFTHGMSAEYAANMISLYDELIAGGKPVEGGYKNYLSRDDYIRFVAETINRFGYVKQNPEHYVRTTARRALQYYNAYYGGRCELTTKEVNAYKREMEEVNFNPESEQVNEEVQSALEWVKGIAPTNTYFNNLKTVCALEYVTAENCGLLASLFPAYQRHKEQEKQEAEKEQQAASSNYVGQIKERISFLAKEIKCVTSWDSDFGTVHLYKMVDCAGNVYTWKTQSIIEEIASGAKVTGTVKAHNEFHGIKQTDLARCKIAC